MKKTLSLLLVLLMMLSTLVACKGNKEDEKNPGSVSTSGGTSSGDDLSRENAVSSLPSDLNFGGTQITIYSRNREDISFELVGDGSSSEALSSAVYYRNLEVETKLGVKLNVQLGPGGYAEKETFMSNIRTNAMSSSPEDVYDIVSGAKYSLVPLSLEGMFSNLLSLDYIDAEKPWWNTSFIDECTYKGKLYTIEGELALSMIDGAFVMFFNKEEFNNTHKNVDLYEIVSAGDWTFARFKEIIKDTWDDDGDGEPNSADSFGLVSPSFACGRDGFPTSFGATVTQTDANGDISVNFATERNQTIWLDFYEFLNSESGVFVNGADDAARTECKSMFEGGKAMFITELLHYAWSLPSTGVDYGVIPLPKYDENQESYRTNSESMHSQFSIASYGPRTEAAAATLELLCFQTYKSVTMTYYEKTMKGKNMNDEQSIMMLDLVVDSITCNFGEQFASILTWPFPVIGTVDDISSYFQGKTAILNVKLPDLLSTLESLD